MRTSVEHRTRQIDPWMPTFTTGCKGSITAGKLADFVILDRDPHDADPDDIKNIGVVRTVVGGRTMHSA